MTVQNLKLRVPVRFPTSVNSGPGIAVTKSAGAWNIAQDFASLSYISSNNIPNQSLKYVIIWDHVTKEFNTTSIADIFETYTNTSVTASPYQLLTNDRTLLINVAGAVTVNLGAQSLRNGVGITVKDISGAASSNNITIQPAGSEKIDGASSLVISADYGGYTLLPYSGGWVIRP